MKMFVNDIIYLEHKSHPNRFNAKKILDQHKVLAFDKLKDLHVQLPIDEFRQVTENEVLEALWK